MSLTKSHESTAFTFTNKYLLKAYKQICQESNRIYIDNNLGFTTKLFFSPQEYPIISLIKNNYSFLLFSIPELKLPPNKKPTLSNRSDSYQACCRLAYS